MLSPDCPLRSPYIVGLHISGRYAYRFALRYVGVLPLDIVKSTIDIVFFKTLIAIILVLLFSVVIGIGLKWNIHRPCELLGFLHHGVAKDILSSISCE